MSYKGRIPVSKCIMVITNVLVPKWHQTSNNNHVESSKTTNYNTGKWIIIYRATASNQTMQQSGRGVARSLIMFYIHLLTTIYRILFFLQVITDGESIVVCLKISRTFQPRTMKCLRSSMRKSAVSKIRKIFTGLTYRSLSSFTAIKDVYRSFIRNKAAFTKYCLTQWISKLHWSFEIHWVIQYLVNFMGLVGMVNVTVYKTELISTGLGLANFPNV